MPGYIIGHYDGDGWLVETEWYSSFRQAIIENVQDIHWQTLEDYEDNELLDMNDDEFMRLFGNDAVLDRGYFRFDEYKDNILIVQDIRARGNRLMFN